MTAEQLRNFLLEQGIMSDAVRIRDARYVMPAEGWLFADFAKGFRTIARQFLPEGYQAEAGDCDDFSLLASFYAGYLHRLSWKEVREEARRAQVEEPAFGALAFGTFDFVREDGEAHSINCAVVAPFGEAKLVFFEPQSGERVDLSEGEICSCFEVRF